MKALSRHTSRRVMTAGCALLLMLGQCWPSFADEADGDRDHHYTEADDDHEAVRKAVNSGQARSLAELKRIVSRRVPGEIVSIELNRENQTLVYEFRILTANGHLVEAEVDAASGRIREIENE
ncbi:PepSY domain-containing protein [Ciceribacter naphthalenivorans]|nr:PepSY domain-containing protein [Ciceribacter naphthalenivorans]